MFPPEKPTWMKRAACRGTDVDLWFPGQGGPVAEAKAICETCPVREQCLDYALSNNEHWGIWGGMADRARRKERRERGMAAPPPFREQEDVA
jgi:WhiB family redox-sensing transcriptional regulator